MPITRTTLPDFASNYYPKEPKLLSVDGAKVHFSVSGLQALVNANIHVIAEPSKLSHLI